MPVIQKYLENPMGTIWTRSFIGAKCTQISQKGGQITSGFDWK